MPYYNVDKILSAALNVIKTYGFKSSKLSVHPTWKRTYDYMKDRHFVNIDTEDESLKIIEWVKSLPPEKCKSSYMSNARQIVERGYCGKHLFGLIVMLIPIYRERNSK